MPATFDAEEETELLNCNTAGGRTQTQSRTQASAAWRWLLCGVVLLALANLLLVAMLFRGQESGRTRPTAALRTVQAAEATGAQTARRSAAHASTRSNGAAIDYRGSSTATAVRVSAFGSADSMRVVEGVTLPALGSSQIRINLSYAGVNPVDTYIRAGSYATLPDLPFTPGEEGSGIIAGVGESIDRERFQVGDRVYVTHCITGSYATACNANMQDVYPLPSNLPLLAGCGLGTPFPAAYRALVSSHVSATFIGFRSVPWNLISVFRVRCSCSQHVVLTLTLVLVLVLQFQRAKAKAGQSVLVNGASGAVGLAAVQLAKAAGMAPVIGTAGSAEGRLLVLEEGGADYVIDHHSPGFHQDAVALTKGGNEGLNVIVESSAHFNLGNDLSALSKDGVVAVVGSRGAVEVDPRDLMSAESSVLGVMLSAASTGDLEETHAAIGAGLADGTIRPYVGVVLQGLESASAAHEEVISHASTGGSARGKICIAVQ